jgi:hypothetical protein
VKVNLESVKHLRRSRTIAQELFNYISITFNKTEVLNKTSKNKVLEGISDIKKYENFSFFFFFESITRNKTLAIDLNSMQ